MTKTIHLISMKRMKSPQGIACGYLKSRRPDGRPSRCPNAAPSRHVVIRWSNNSGHSQPQISTVARNCHWAQVRAQGKCTCAGGNSSWIVWMSMEDCKQILFWGTEWRRLIGSFVFVGHFLQKWPMFSGFLVEQDLQLRGPYESAPPCRYAKGILGLKGMGRKIR